MIEFATQGYLENLTFSNRESRVRSMEMDRSLLERALETLGSVLEQRRLQYDFRHVLVETLRAFGVDGADADV